MTSDNRPLRQPQTVQDWAFLLLLAAVSLAFVVILRPLFGAVLWGIVLAILFRPVYRWFLAPLRQRRSLAALVTVTIIVVMLILPLSLVAVSLVQEASGVLAKVQSGELSPARYFQQIYRALPAWAASLLDRFGVGNLAAVQEKLLARLAEGSQALAGHALLVGLVTLDFAVSVCVMLYLLFFLLRDADELSRQVRAAIPLRPAQQRSLFETFSVVIRATVKGTLVVAVIQGALGGLIFWLLGIHAPLLWAVVMAVVSLVPAVGAALIWLPVALYLLVTGAVWQGLVLIAYGVLVIGLVDNVLRPFLVGQDTRMPDYLVLISTLGGIAIFGGNGFVIGPVIAALFIAAWSIFSAELRNTAD
jgi:predicted PurR-regulated permease PerM